MPQKINGRRYRDARNLLTATARSSLSTSASASRNSFSISFFSFRAFFAFLLRCGRSVLFPLARRAAALLLDCFFAGSSLSVFDSDARTPSSVLRRRCKRQERTSGWMLNRFSFTMRFSKRTISKDTPPVRSSRNTLIKVLRHRSED